jgi:hypothetical protein
MATRQHAAEIMARYAAPESAKLRRDLNSDVATQQDYYACCALLNSLEEIAIAHKHGLAHATLLKDAFATSLRGWLEKPYIASALRRARSKDPARYENALDLYVTWGGADPLIRSIERVGEIERE